VTALRYAQLTKLILLGFRICMAMLLRLYLVAIVVMGFLALQSIVIAVHRRGLHHVLSVVIQSLGITDPT
jgi:hypothetical protein